MAKEVLLVSRLKSGLPRKKRKGGAEVDLDITKFKKTIKSPFSGQEYEIVRVSQRDLFSELGLLPLIVAAPVEERLAKISGELKKKLDNPEEDSKARRFLLERGVRPKIWFGEESECPAGQLPASCAGDDIYWLANEITEFAFDLDGLKGDKFFRGGEPADPGPGGPEVRSETVVAGAGNGAEPDIAV